MSAVKCTLGVSVDNTWSWPHNCNRIRNIKALFCYW